MDSQTDPQLEARTVKGFITSVKGLVKIIRLILIIIALMLHVIALAPEPYIVITTLEGISVLFFIVLYILRLDLLWKWLFWPLLDILNSLMSTVFLMIVSVLALVAKAEVMITIAGVFGIVATVFAIADAALIYRKLMFNPSGPFEKKQSHEKKRRSRHSRHSHHSHHSQHNYQARAPPEKSEDL
ncbi:chemokine-like factor [Petaurus breviceps papuanus]|uniref:chemokine-like factor n=1 Tax=Petaurus breviceps papuanus TaxID=3040969 RepID=UPI0036D98CDC